MKDEPVYAYKERANAYGHWVNKLSEELRKLKTEIKQTEKAAWLSDLEKES